MCETCWGEKKKKKRKKQRVIRPWVRRAEIESHIRPFCESSRVSKNTKRYLATWEVQSVWRDKEKHSKSVREWKRKRRLVSLLKLHTKNINWWSSHRVFECYNHGEFEHSKEDFVTGFVVRLYLLLEIYLLYIQFIVDSSLA